MTANRDDVQIEMNRGTTNVRREHLLPSRRQALHTLRSALLAKGNGPVLLTGEPGTGKSWLYRRLIEELPASWRAISVAMSEALDTLDFLRLVGHGLGVQVAQRVSSARMALSSTLRDESASGRSWLLVIENAQDASSQVWSEVLALVHEMEAARGLGAMLLVGPTELARKLSTRQFASLASRLGAHAHLLPLDLDEAHALLDFQDRMPAVDLHELEKLHRDEGGNPRRMMRLWRQRPGLSADLAIEPRSAVPNLPSTGTTLSATDSEPAGDQSFAAADSHVASEALTAIPEFELSRGTPAWTESRSLVPSRPPLRVEDGLVEVGWKESFEAETAAMKPTEGEQSLSPLPPVVEGDNPLARKSSKTTTPHSRRGRNGRGIAAECPSRLGPAPSPSGRRAPPRPLISTSWQKLRPLLPSRMPRSGLSPSTSTRRTANSSRGSASRDDRSAPKRSAEC